MDIPRVSLFFSNKLKTEPFNQFQCFCVLDLREMYLYPPSLPNSSYDLCVILDASLFLSP